MAEYLNDRVQVFSVDGKPLAVFGSSGSGKGQLDAPAAAAQDDQGIIYVADFYNHRKQPHPGVCTKLFEGLKWEDE